jgi:unsaturated chondroitin disaccharide hydrolase
MFSCEKSRSTNPFIAIMGGAFATSMALAAQSLPELVAHAWAVAEQRSEASVSWMDATYGSPLMFSRYPRIGNLATGRWQVAENNSDWRTGFWPGTLWLLAERNGGEAWKQRATDWSAVLATSANIDHDIGFITLASLGKGWQFHDDLTDPGGTYRAFAKQALITAATKLDSRFNMANSSGAPVPAGFTRSWNTPFEDPYPVCMDNLMNIEVMSLAYEINGRLPEQRVWFDHALTHARNSIARHLRPDGGTYHVVKHFESGPKIGQIERKSTLQGYGDETTWSRGQAWAIYGFTSAYRHARLDPGTDASDLLAAARTAAGYFIDHLPHYFAADSYNHRIGDFVPPSDFDAARGEPSGPWNDANGNYNSSSGSGLGDRKPPTSSFTLRDTSAAAVAAAALIELSGFVPSPSDSARFLKAAEDILQCLISYDGPDADTAPDYFCSADESAHPGILKAGSVRWNDPNQSLIYGDYYFLEALARYDALCARKLLNSTQRAERLGSSVSFTFEIISPSPALAFRVQRSPDLGEGSWTTVAAKTGAAPWSGSASVTEESLPENRTRVSVADPNPGNRGFFRILTRSIGGGGP